jgi:hypothetical protein
MLGLINGWANRCETRCFGDGEMMVFGVMHGRK